MNQFSQSEVNLHITILGWLHLAVGTLIGIYAIWVLLQEATPSYFRLQGSA
ncbi:MAG: hypothetical protein KDI02_20860 [Anaerolineae bacterium]|nr:hypothetical protein [Anaerolineae bacterium]MCB0180675.1 hypothetical protein [Anaerolineae bacterium]MCB0226153.1 hypothetical protein [Anaerolineae bacterium]